MVLNFLSQARNPKPLDQMPDHNEHDSTETDFPSDVLVRLQAYRNIVDFIEFKGVRLSYPLIVQYKLSKLNIRSLKSF